MPVIRAGTSALGVVLEGITDNAGRLRVVLSLTLLTLSGTVIAVSSTVRGTCAAS